MHAFIEILLDPNTRWVLSACLLLGLSSGVIGSFTLLRKQSLIGDAMAHAALPGICLAFIIFSVKSLGWFMLGAALAGLVAAYFISSIIKYSRIKEDTALGLILSVFFGLGIVLLTIIQHSSKGNQSGLDDFLFGKAASLVATDVQVMMVVSIILLLSTLFLFKELKLLCFDPNFGQGLGIPMGFINLILMTMVVLVVVTGLQAVGVVLMSALLISPPIAARYWTERLGMMVIIAGFFGAISGILGTILSITIGNLPTGPVIVLAATLLFLLSLIFAPQRGLLMKSIRLFKLRKRVALENILQSLYDLEEKDLLRSSSTLYIGSKEEEILQKRPVSKGLFTKLIRQLHRDNLISIINKENNTYMKLSDIGLDKAFQISLDQRMWDMLLMYENKFSGLKIQKGQELKAQLSQETILELEHLLHEHQQYPTLNTKNREKVFKGHLQKDISSLSQNMKTKGSGL